MPTPIAPGVIRAQTVFQGKSGLPEDRFVTTMHFRTPLAGTATGTDGAQALHHAAARDKVVSFWLDASAASGGSVKLVDFLSPAVTRGPDALQVRTYHLGDPEIREPTVTTHEILGAGMSTGLPAEVACCLSFSGSRPNLPRERGRLYIGPLNTSAMDIDATLGRVKVAPMLREALSLSALRIAGGDDTEPARWVVYSPTNNNSVLVRRGFIDDGFDTQRRRGEQAIDRIAFTVPA